MGERVSTYAKKAENYAPWKNELAWYWVAVEGAIGVIIGLYFLFASDAASSNIRYLVAFVLIAASAYDLWIGFRNTRSVETMMIPMNPYRLARGGMGLALGIVAVAAERSSDISDSAALLLIGCGLVAWGVVGLIGNIDAVFSSRGSWLGTLGNALALLLGVALLYNNQQDVAGNTATRYLGYGALIGGAILLVYSYFVKKGQEAEAAEAAAVTSAASVPVPSIPTPANPAATLGSAGTVLDTSATGKIPVVPTEKPIDGQ